MKDNTIVFEDNIVKIRCTGQMLILMGEGLHTPGDPTGEAFIRLGQDLLGVFENLDQVLDALLVS